MKLAYITIAVLAFPLMVAAQTSANHATAANPQGAAAGITAPGFPFPGGFNPPAGLFEHFWNDPECVAELHLTEVQRKQLQDAALAQRLSFIDNGAEALKSLARLSAVLEADQLDDAAYKQQMNNLAAATGKLVQDVGEMAVSPRRVLTVEQWKKLQSWQRAKKAAARAAVTQRPSTSTHTPTAGEKP